MKKTLIFITALALTALTLVTSCQKDSQEYRILTGEKVRFSVGSAGAGTKAVYSGEGTATLERIDWKKNDIIRIYCEAVREPAVTKYADYKVTEDGKAKKDYPEISETDIEATEGAGLVWGEGDHTFYAVYPSPASSGITGSISGNSVSGNLPSTDQGNKGMTESSGNYVVTPDLKWMMMTAKAGPYTPESDIADEVSLDFQPLTTAIEFTIYNGNRNAALDINRVLLISKNTQISGTFTVDIDTPDAANYPTCTGTLPGSREVCINMPSGISLAKATGDGTDDCKSLKFTFFLAPTTDVSDLTFKLYKSETAWMQTRLGYTDGSGVEFPCHKKSFVKGLIVPEGAQWTVKYGPTVDPWNQESSDIDPMPEVSIDPFVTSWDTGIDDELSLEPKESDVNFIDLGLPSGTLWADRNVGAKSIIDEPTCYGDYYAWSKTETYYEQESSNPPVDVEWKDAYSNGYVQEYGFPYTKYDATDGLKRLELADDVANVVIGGGAQIPSVAQWNELIANCTWTKTKKGENGGYGYLTLTSKINGKSIILPAGGFYSGTANTNYGNFGVYYMTSELSATDLSSVYATWCGATEDLQCVANYSRFAGMPVRAVKKKPVEYVEIGGLKWATCNVGANTPKDYGWYFSWGGTTGYVRDGSKWVTAQGGSELSGGFSWANAPYNTGGVSTSWNKYIPTGKGTYWSGGGSPDNKLSLDPEDDAVRASLGSSWRMPTQADFQTLYEACGGTNPSSGIKPTALSSSDPGKGIYWVSNTQTYISDYDGVAGILFCDGASKLFFVAAGYGTDANFTGGGTDGRYWSGTVYSTNPSCAYRLGFFQSSNVCPANANDRNQGYPVRPVSDL